MALAHGRVVWAQLQATIPALTMERVEMDRRDSLQAARVGMVRAAAVVEPPATEGAEAVVVGDWWSLLPTELRGVLESAREAATPRRETPVELSLAAGGVE